MGDDLIQLENPHKEFFVVVVVFINCALDTEKQPNWHIIKCAPVISDVISLAELKTYPITLHMKLFADILKGHQAKSVYQSNDSMYLVCVCIHENLAMNNTTEIS